MGFIKLGDWDIYVATNKMSDESSDTDKKLAKDEFGGDGVAGEGKPEEVKELPKDERLEPIVYLDPKIQASTIVKQFVEQHSNVVPTNEPSKEEPNSTGTVGTPTNTDDTSPMKPGNEENDTTKTNGILVPLVNIAGQIIDDSNIVKLRIATDDILPELDLVIKDEKELISTMAKPGLGSTITVILLPPKDGAYKKISLDFTIDSYYEDYDDDDVLNLEYYGKYKLNQLHDFKNMAVHYIGTSTLSHNLGSHNIISPSSPTTWETLYHIATNTGLGLATNPDIEKLNDKMFRLIQGSYLDEIKEMQNMGGLSEKEIFEIWIDFNHYLNCVNLPRIFNSEVKYNNLTINTTTKAHTTDKNLTKQEIITVPRVLTNCKETPTQNDLLFYHYIAHSDPSDVIDNGASQQSINMNTSGNNLQKQDLQIVENSIDGAHIEDYSTLSFLQVEMDMSSAEFGRDIKLQEKIIKNYKRKINAQHIMIWMQNPNFGLSRGHLVQVSFLTYEAHKKQKILDNMLNTMFDQDQLSPVVQKSKKKMEDFHKTIINDDSKGVPDPTLSGLYYIKSVTYRYSNKTQKLEQILKLLKKDRIIKLVNKHTAPSLNVEANEGNEGGGVENTNNVPQKTSSVNNKKLDGYELAKDIGFKIF